MNRNAYMCFMSKDNIQIMLITILEVNKDQTYHIFRLSLYNFLSLKGNIMFSLMSFTYVSHTLGCNYMYLL